MKYYSWKDIDRYFLDKQNEWMKYFTQVEVYPDSVIIYQKTDTEKPISTVLSKMFPRNYDHENNVIKLDIDVEPLSIINEIPDDSYRKPYIPLFREILYRESVFEGKLPSIPCPVIAFHSYKGGVGRTLSLLAFAKAWSYVYETKENSKLLIVDSDVEAPGLTWIQDNPIEDAFSYLDLLSIVQDNPSIDTAIALSLPQIGSSTITIESNNSNIDHYFLPTYRYENQWLDLYAKPETVINGKNKEYALTEVLSQIGKGLGVGAVLVDLRAGLSEISAPILLDPRVKKYLVTSTSKQSISGTKTILNFLAKGMKINANTILPEIFLNMVPDNLSVRERGNIHSELLNVYYSNSKTINGDYFDNIITELPFASELIHLKTIDHINACLNDREMFIRIKAKVEQDILDYGDNPKKDNLMQKREELLEKIKTIASEQIAAEGNTQFDLMMTAPLKHLGQQYSNELPTTIIMGAKGSGKTFIYRKMIEASDWSTFFNQIGFSKSGNYDTFFLPVLATKNSTRFTTALKNCIHQINKKIKAAKVSESIYLENEQTISGSGKISNWKTFWERIIVRSFSEKYSTFSAVDEALKKEKKKVVFLFDGLEEYFPNTFDSIREKDAIRFLCQDIITWINNTCSNIGIIVFLRRDLAQNAITVNYSQFRKAYEKTELKWSSNEALRLAVWLVNQADSTFYEETVDISTASQSIIEKYLKRLWGLKLGKSSSNEAYSSRWILAALSDFNGQLQARDIIRFLQYASISTSKKPAYDDRILMPADIKIAVQKCSTEKMSEIKDEYISLKPIFERLEKLSTAEKTLPIKPAIVKLTPAEEIAMTQEGYLKRDGEVYYLPEIVRHALGYRYEKGARPKVLSLLLKHGDSF